VRGPEKIKDIPGFRKEILYNGLRRLGIMTESWKEIGARKGIPRCN
jgi:hypothetical protein